MPIEYHIDHARRLVVARARGRVDGSDLDAYQAEVWSKPEVSGYNELVDMTEVSELHAPKNVGATMENLAAVSAASDTPEIPTKFAIVASAELAFGLGRMYQSIRELERRSTKEVGVFRTLPEALSFLGIDSLEWP